MADLVRNFIGGKWIEARSGETFDSINPATEVSRPVYPRRVVYVS